MDPTTNQSTLAVVSSTEMAGADETMLATAIPPADESAVLEQIAAETADAEPPADDAEVAELIAAIESAGPGSVIGIDMAAGPDVSVIEFDIERLDVAYRLPVVSADVETVAAPMTPRSITVFKGQDGKNMELVLAWNADVVHQPDGLLMIDPSTGMCLAAQPLVIPQE